MGKNLYETPRDKNKWNTSNQTKDRSVNLGNENEKKSRLEELKSRYKKNHK